MDNSEMPWIRAIKLNKVKKDREQTKLQTVQNKAQIKFMFKYVPK